MLASDAMRLQLARCLPLKARSSQLRLGSPVNAVAVAPLRGAGSGLRALVVLTLDGQLQWFRGRGGAPAPLESMGRLAGSATAVDLGRGGSTAALAVGHKGGNVSVWHAAQEEPPSWRRVALLRVAHHEWEDVDRVATSGDGRLLLACTGDNVALWWLSEEEGGEALELEGLHGGDSQLSAAAIGGPGVRGYAVALAFQVGDFRGWGVEVGEPPELDPDLWSLPPSSARPRLVAVAVAPGAAVVAAAGADGRAWLWRLKASGRGLEGPLWEVRPSPQGLPVASLELLAEPPRTGGEASCWAAMGFGGQVAVLDCETGKEAHRSTQPGGSVLALSWG